MHLYRVRAAHIYIHVVMQEKYNNLCLSKHHYSRWCILHRLIMHTWAYNNIVAEISRLEKKYTYENR